MYVSDINTDQSILGFSNFHPIVIVDRHAAVRSTPFRSPSNRVQTLIDIESKCGLKSAY